MVKFCGVCGTELLETDLGKWFCRNCGILEENQDRGESNNQKNGEVSYIG